MELPIFQENLRSSGSWAAELERAKRDWLEASPEARSHIADFQVSQGLSRISTSGAEVMAEPYRQAARFVTKWAESTDARLDVERLQVINAAMLNAAPGSATIRTVPGRRRGEYHDPAPAIIVERLLENALDWFETPSFAEIHAVEQAAVVLLRLTDLQPFEHFSEETALLAASLFLERAALPPLIVEADEATMSEYNAALEAAFKMLTQPLVEFLSKTLIRTIAQAKI